MSGGFDRLNHRSRRCRDSSCPFVVRVSTTGRKADHDHADHAAAIHRPRVVLPLDRADLRRVHRALDRADPCPRTSSPRLAGALVEDRPRARPRTRRRTGRPRSRSTCPRLTDVGQRADTARTRADHSCTTGTSRGSAAADLAVPRRACAISHRPGCVPTRRGLALSTTYPGPPSEEANRGRARAH